MPNNMFKTSRNREFSKEINTKRDKNSVKLPHLVVLERLVLNQLLDFKYKSSKKIYFGPKFLL